MPGYGLRMAVSAKDLPGYLANATHDTDHVVIGGVQFYLASVDQTWGLSTDSDLFKITLADFNAIKGATVDNGGAGPYLVVGGQVREVARVAPFGAAKWAGVREPEE